MNLRKHAPLHHPGIQLAPLVDVLLLLLIFFLLTWNAARNENELDVKVPKASSAKEKSAPIGDVRYRVSGARLAWKLSMHTSPGACMFQPGSVQRGST